MRTITVLAVSVSAACFVACSAFTWDHHVRSRASDDTGCPSESIKVKEVSWAAGRWEAEGCGAKSAYRCWHFNGPHCSRVDVSK